MGGDDKFLVWRVCNELVNIFLYLHVQFNCACWKGANKSRSIALILKKKKSKRGINKIAGGFFFFFLFGCGRRDRVAVTSLRSSQGSHTNELYVAK